MNYTELLKKSAKELKSIVCLGLDPVLDNIPEEGQPGDQIKKFYENMLSSISREKIYPGCVKPNYAFYAQYGIDGIKALQYIIDIYSKEGIPVILDVKRGDIGKTAQAYAVEAYDFFKAHSVTLSPYLGYDSIEPFMKNYPDTGAYILTKTSNKSSGEIQDIDTNGEPLYIYMAKKIVQWHTPGLGSVVGATYPQQLKEISEIFIASGKEIPLLIPGIGSQGGDINEVMNTLRTFPDASIHRINSSSAINYAYKKYENMSYGDAAVKALEELNTEIGSF